MTYKCFFCNRSFKSFNSMVIHLRKCFFETFPFHAYNYKCIACETERKFHKEDALRAHIAHAALSRSDLEHKVLALIYVSGRKESYKHSYKIIRKMFEEKGEADYSSLYKILKNKFKVNL